VTDNITVNIDAAEPEVGATLDDLRFLVFQGKKGETGANGRDGQDGAPGAPGTPGADGVSPTVQTEAITGGHRVTITDAEYPQGQSFDVMDGVLAYSFDDDGETLYVENLVDIPDAESEAF
jgi:hypothetical protein